MEFLHKLVKKSDIVEFAKTAENMGKRMMPTTEHQENEENFYPEHKKYFSAPRI